jgi:murein DD-endopeptidase MepM/ murein hydrolase activator NlpD
MKKIILILLIALLSYAGVKENLNKTKIYISKMNEKLDNLAKAIAKKEKELNKISSQIKTLNIEIKKLQNELQNSNKTLTELNDLKKGYLIKQKNIQNKINYFLSTNYYLDSQQIDNINDLLQNEILNALLKKYSSKIEKLLNENRTIQKNIEITNQKINEIIKKQNELKNKKLELIKLLKKQKTEIANLKRQKINYKKKLYTLIKRQKALQRKLEELKVVKTQPKVTHVKTYNANYRVKTANYRGSKTIPPLRGKIIKKFGSYIDPVYKIRIYNDSITIKPYEENAKVRAIMSGKVVYIGESNDKKIIVIKHKNKIFSIYANLDKISPLIKKGRYVKKGQIIARVKNNLEFEVTYKDRPINPIKVVKF